jgi:ABC-type transporter Mla subunit MlaD
MRDFHIHFHEHDRGASESLKQLLQLGDKIMNAITDYVAQQKQFNDANAQAVDKLTSATAGITADLKTLHDKLSAIQNSPGTLSPEDQQALNDALAASSTVSSKLKTVADALAALDQLNPPEAPTNLPPNTDGGGVDPGTVTKI